MPRQSVSSIFAPVNSTELAAAHAQPAQDNLEDLYRQLFAVTKDMYLAGDQFLRAAKAGLDTFLDIDKRHLLTSLMPQAEKTPLQANLINLNKDETVKTCLDYCELEIRKLAEKGTLTSAHAAFVNSLAKFKDAFTKLADKSQAQMRTEREDASLIKDALSAVKSMEHVLGGASEYISFRAAPAPRH